MARTVSRYENLRTLRVANIDSAFAAAFMALASGAFLVKLIQELGAGLPKAHLDLWIGWMTAVPSLLGLLQIPGAVWGRSFPHYKPFVAPGGLIWRLLYLPLLAIPFLPIPATAALGLLLLCIGLASVAIHIVSPIYNDWLAEMVPADSRGWFFSRRNAIAAAMSAGAAVLGGVVFDQFKNADQVRYGFLVIFSLSAIFAAISVGYFNKMTDIPRANPVRGSLKSSVAGMVKPFRDRAFRTTLVFFAFAVLGQGFAGNLFGAYAFESLRMSMLALQITAICHAAGNIGSIRMWGFLADKYGNKPILAILLAGIALTPVPWIFCRPGDDVFNATILGIGHVFAGICWGGITVTQFNLLLATAKPEERANYIGTGMALQAVIGAASPLLGALVMGQLRVGVEAATAYHIIFGITIALRALSVVFLIPVREEGSASIRGTLTQLAKVSPSGYRALRTMTDTEDAQEREAAIASAADAGFDLVRGEVERALHDPSPRVRRQAAAALARLGGNGSAQHLIHMLHEHPDLVEEEMIEALGKLGQGAEALVPYLQSPRSIIRRASARALAEMGGPTASAALTRASGPGSDPDLRRAALQGVRALALNEAEAEVADALLDPHPSVRIAAAEAVEELLWASAATPLRAALDRYADEASSELAYALGCVGDQADIPRILQEARRGTSLITRRRCLLGVARLLGVEGEVYRLMLLGGMSLDNALLKHMEGLDRRDDRIGQAMELFARGDEPGALVLLAELEPALVPVAETPVDEAALVALCHVAKQSRS